jgi:putative endonuclease
MSSLHFKFCRPNEARMTSNPDTTSGSVYVLGTVSGSRRLTYVGWTTDVAKRLAKHNAGTGARTTRGRVWVLLHSERFATRREAMSREWHLKRDRAFRRQLALTISV